MVIKPHVIMTETRRKAIKYELIPPVHNQLELWVEGVL